MDKREYVIESIKKLLSLNVSDDEILSNLYDVGISRKEALELISEAKGQARPTISGTSQNTKSFSQGAAVVQESKDDMFDVDSNAGLDDDINSQLGFKSDAPQKNDASVGSIENLESGLKIKQSRPQPMTKGPVQGNAASQQKPIPQQSPLAAQNTTQNTTAQQNNAQNRSPTLSEKEVAKEPQTKPPESKNFFGFLKPQQPQEPKIQPSEPQKEISKEPVQGSAQAPLQNNVSQTSQSQVSPVAPTMSQTNAQVQIPQMDDFTFNENASVAQSNNQTLSAEEELRELMRKPMTTNATQMNSQKPLSQPTSFSQNPTMNQSAAMDAARIKYGDESADEFWKKGIVVTVNARLSEMKKMRDEVDSLVEEKVDQAVQKELAQYKVLFESQKDLIISSNKEALEEKQKEISFIIDAKIAELKQYNKEISQNLTAFEEARLAQQESMQKLAASLDDARRTKTQLIVEMNSEIIKSKGSAQAFIDESQKHIQQMDQRVNKTLELEKNIAEGMLAEAEQKIEAMSIQRADELIRSLETELNNLVAMQKRIDPASIEQKVALLEEFKKQFLVSMQDNISKLNAAIQQLNLKTEMADSLLEEKSLAIDAKIEELTRFEKEFTDKLEKKVKK